MYQQPTRADLDRNLSTLTQGVQDKARTVKDGVAGAVELLGWAHNSRFIVQVADALDTLHKEFIAAAMHVVKDFTERMRRPASEVAAMARPRLESLAAVLLSEIPEAGFPHEQQTVRAKYAQDFQSRLDDALRDIAVGFIGGRSLIIKDSDRRAVALGTFYDQRHRQDWTPLPVDPAASAEEQTIVSNICKQLAQGGLIEWKGVAGAAFGMGRITNRGVDVMEGNETPPIALTTVDARQYSVASSSNVQIGDGGNRMHVATSTVARGDVAALDKRLKEIGIDGAAIDALHKAIKDDETSGQKPSLGGKVGEWLGKQTTRAAAGAFEIGLDKVTPALIDAIKSFFPN